MSARGKASRAKDPLLDRILTNGAPPSGEASERILAAATQQVEDFGVRRFTIDDVARRVGVSRVTIYRYFPKKDRLIEAVLLRELHRFLRAIDAAVEECETLEERLVEGFVFALTFLRNHRLLNRLLRTEPELILPALTVNAATVLAASREFIAGFARREADRGGLPLEESDIEGVSELLARAVMSFVLTPSSVLGLDTPAEIRRFAEHYLAPTLRTLRELPPARRDMSAAPDHEVAIIGAGLSGLGMGAALRRAGIEDFVILERADDVGGTWRDNTYPGIGVDIPTFAYQFSYDIKPDWSSVFAKGPEVKAYIDDYTAKYSIRPHVRFGSEVTARTWDGDDHVWRLAINGNGNEVTARFVVSAIGAFVDPKPVDIDGLDEFAGKVIHSARWDHAYDLAGRRVAVIGTGASAVQIIPSIAREVARMDVYQRTPIWVSPKFDPEIPERVKKLFARVPLTARIARWVASAITEFVLIFMVVNYKRVPFVARWIERYNRRWVARSVRDPELRRKLTPDYGMGCKRPSVSNDYLRTFNRDNVELVTDPIERITAKGVRTADGSEREVDAIVFATGFRLSSDPENYRRTPVHGRDGFDLATHYAEHRLKSYEGISMPGLPNHFMIFGPYGWTGASWHVLVQTASRHITRVIEECRRRGAEEVEVTPEATERFYALVQRRMAGSLWFNSNCATSNSYYFDHHGDVPFLRPTSARQARHASRSFPLDDYRYSALSA